MFKSLTDYQKEANVHYAYVFDGLPARGKCTLYVLVWDGFPERGNFFVYVQVFDGLPESGKCTLYVEILYGLSERGVFDGLLEKGNIRNKNEKITH